MQRDGECISVAVSTARWSPALESADAAPAPRCSIATRVGAARRWALSAPQAAASLTVVAATLAVLFAAVRLAGAIDWPWLWVLAPIWGLFAGVLVFTTAFAVAALRAGAGQRSVRPRLTVRG